MNKGMEGVRDFPSSPVVRASSSSAEVCGFDPLVWSLGDWENENAIGKPGSPMEEQVHYRCLSTESAQHHDLCPQFFFFPYSCPCSLCLLEPCWLPCCFSNTLSPAPTLGPSYWDILRRYLRSHPLTNPHIFFSNASLWKSLRISQRPYPTLFLFSSFSCTHYLLTHDILFLITRFTI